MRVDDPQLLFETLVSKRGPKRFRADAEFRLQCAVADMLWKLQRPGWWWSAIPSGEYRTEATGKRLKRMGLKPGMFDIVLIGPDSTHYWLELKADKGVMSEDQLIFEEMLCGRGVSHAVVWGFGEAERQLREWGVLRPEAQ
jgi:hypothetical protein